MFVQVPVIMISSARPQPSACMTLRGLHAPSQGGAMEDGRVVDMIPVMHKQTRLCHELIV